MLESGTWAKLAGDESALRDLAMVFTGPSLRIVADQGAYYLGSCDFTTDTPPDAVRSRGSELLAIACGSCALEFGTFSPPWIDAVTCVDAEGHRQDLRPVRAVARMPFEVNALEERERADGMIEVVEVTAPPSTYGRWHEEACNDDDVADILAILGRTDVRWHDLWHVYEIVKANTGSRLFDEGWISKAEEARFTRTANSRGAIGREARHGHDLFSPPKRPMDFDEARRLVHTLARRWLDLKVPPAPPLVVRVVEVRPPVDAANKPAPD